MPRKVKPASESDVILVALALHILLRAQRNLRLAGAPMAARAVGRAIKSTEGAYRHAQRRRRYEPVPDPR